MKYVLILEDNESSLNGLRKAVEEISGKIHVCAARSIEEACQILYQYRTDLFILDIVLTTTVPGDTSGIILAEKIRKIDYYKFTPIIFITALIDPELYAYRNLHSYGYIEKPFNMDEVVELIASALRFPSPEIKTQIEYFRKDGILIAIDLKRVVYAEVCNRAMSIHLVDDVLEIPYITVKRFLQQSQMNELLQCNRYTVVNMLFVKSIDLTRRYLQMRDGTRIEIGMAYADQLRAWNVDL